MAIAPCLRNCGAAGEWNGGFYPRPSSPQSLRPATTATVRTWNRRSGALTYSAPCSFPRFTDSSGAQRFSFLIELSSETPLLQRRIGWPRRARGDYRFRLRESQWPFIFTKRRTAAMLARCLVSLATGPLVKFSHSRGCGLIGTSGKRKTMDEHGLMRSVPCAHTHVSGCYMR